MNDHNILRIYNNTQSNIKNNKRECKDIFTNIQQKIIKHANITMDANNEFVKTRNKHIYILKVNNAKYASILLCFAILYHALSVFSSKKYCIGLDFEFNKRVVATAQLSFYYKKTIYIFVYEPNIYNDEHEKIIINTIYTSNIKRVLHGSESLDIFYIYTDLLKNDKNNIIKFTSSVIDTRFMCELHKIQKKHNDNKCSIYDALLFFGVINQSKYNDLDEIGVAMGPIQYIDWNIHKMNDARLQYTLYDVLYLKQLGIKLKKILGKSSYKIVNNVFRLVVYDKYKIISVISAVKEIVDPLNNYFIIKNQTQHTLISLFNKYVLSIPPYVSELLRINYFKSSLSIIIKHILYNHIFKTHIVFSGKEQPFSAVLDITLFFPELQKFGLKYIINMINDCLLIINMLDI